MGQSYSLSVECEEEATQTTEEPVSDVMGSCVSCT